MSFRSARLKAGKKVADVMEHFGVSDASVYFWECGTYTPRAKLLQELAKFYGCTIEELLDGNEPLRKEANNNENRDQPR